MGQPNEERKLTHSAYKKEKEKKRKRGNWVINWAMQKPNPFSSPIE
jgi:hypothetical protein